MFVSLMFVLKMETLCSDDGWWMGRKKINTFSVFAVLLPPDTDVGGVASTRRDSLWRCNNGHPDFIYQVNGTPLANQTAVTWPQLGLAELW